MTKEDIIKEYIPFMVKRILKNCEPPKNEEEFIQFSRELGRYILDRFGNEKETLIKAGQQFKIDSIEELKEAYDENPKKWRYSLHREISDFNNGLMWGVCDSDGIVFIHYKQQGYETIPNPFKKEDPIREELKALREEVEKLKGEKTKESPEQKGMLQINLGRCAFEIISREKWVDVTIKEDKNYASISLEKPEAIKIVNYLKKHFEI